MIKIKIRDYGEKWWVYDRFNDETSNLTISKILDLMDGGNPIYISDDKNDCLRIKKTLDKNFSSSDRENQGPDVKRAELIPRIKQ